MGGNIFKNPEARRATQKDLVYIQNVMDEHSIEFEFLGSCAWLKESYGDVDVAVRPTGAGPEADQEAFINIAGHHFDQYKTVGNTLFAQKDGAQFDITFVDSLGTFKDWIRPATTVSAYDPYKALYRNELLFAVVKWLWPNEVVQVRGPHIVRFARYRYTLFDGIVKEHYSYVGARGWVTQPQKIEGTIWKSQTSFTSLYAKLLGKERLDYVNWSSDFADTLKYIDSRWNDGYIKYEIIGEVWNGLHKKKQEVPDIIKSLYYKNKEIAVADGYSVWENEPFA